MRQRIYDETTGEIVRDEEFSPKQKHKNYHYYLTFYEALGKANIDITATMHIILGQMDAKNRIVLDKEKLHTLQSNYHKTPNSFKITVGKMCNSGMMQRTSSAFYFANPYYFTKTNVYKLEELRKEYAELLFNHQHIPKKKAKTYEQQIADILKA